MRLHGDPVDKQIRGNINKIAFVALAFTAVVILLAVWFFAAKKPIAVHPQAHTTHDHTQPQ